MDPVICPLCHKPHTDPPDLAGGRVKACKVCHPPPTVLEPLEPETSPKKKTRKRRPPKE